MRAALILACLLALSGCGRLFQRHEPPQLVVWAWERPEDLRFLPPNTEIAIHTGFVELSGETLTARGRYFAMKTERPPQTLVVHVQIDHRTALNWTPTLRARTAAAVLHYALLYPARRVQIDFEVRQSERPVLLDLLHDVRAGLPKDRLLSMTALASWCQTETWLDQAPVDEVTPMLFRMEDGGEAIRQWLAKGHDFRNPKCHLALAVSTDSPIKRAPPGRRVYLFNPKSWTPADFAAARREVTSWR